MTTLAADHDLRTRLRTATSVEHDRLDRLLSQSGIFTSRERYARFLNLQFRAFRSYETAVDRHAAINSAAWWPGDMRSRAIRDDIGVLGTTGSAVPEGTDWHQRDLDDFETLIGRCYVMEGSSLGSTVLISRYGERLEITADHGGKYFSLGKTMPGRWKNFCQWLNRLDLDAAGEIEVIVSARDSFGAYIDMISPLARE